MPADAHDDDTKDTLPEASEGAAVTVEHLTDFTETFADLADHEVMEGAWSAGEQESTQETMFWLAQPGILESITEAEADVGAGSVYTEDQIRAEFNTPRNRSR